MDDLEPDRDSLAAALRERLSGADELILKCYADAESMLAEYSPERSGSRFWTCVWTDERRCAG
ncbi:MAG: hypothetical protein J5449_10785 [Oscillospiraceae bacterium]|nr:hypothetical protein [Oscillospiraceae bacterium]